MTDQQGVILVVDDNPINRKVLTRNLLHEGFTCEVAEDGAQAMAFLRSRTCDVVLLDLMMPEMDGFQVLEAMKADAVLQHLPVIVISSLDQTENAIRCIEMGATDYIMKPFDPVFLRARVNASLARKRLHDLEKALLHQIQMEQEQSERLLLNVLPAPIAQRLKQGEQVIVDSFSEVTVVFADIVGFTSLAAKSSPDEIVNLLNAVFSIFDGLTNKYQLEKIKTVGDAYMVAGGLPLPRAGHLESAANMALDIQKIFSEFKAASGEPVRVRIGIHTGPVVAGVIGMQKFIYDLWGDTVNVASRLESHGSPGQIQVSAEVYTRLQGRYLFEPRGITEIKGRGAMETYWLVGRQD